MRQIFSLIAAATLLALSGWGASTGGTASVDEPRPAAEATACLAGDQAVASSAMCLQDDAACYPLADGSWCTGPRVSTCPMGSNPLPAELPCPEGARCFSQSESLQCVIGG